MLMAQVLLLVLNFFKGWKKAIYKCKRPVKLTILCYKKDVCLTAPLICPGRELLSTGCSYLVEDWGHAFQLPTGKYRTDHIPHSPPVLTLQGGKHSVEEVVQALVPKINCAP